MWKLNMKDFAHQAAYIAFGMLAAHGVCWLIGEPRPGSDYYFGLTVGVMVAYKPRYGA